MPISRPSADVSRDAGVVGDAPGNPGHTTNLYLTIDETTRDDDDIVYGVGDLVVTLDPAVPAGSFTLRFAAKADVGDQVVVFLMNTANTVLETAFCSEAAFTEVTVSGTLSESATRARIRFELNII